MKHGNSYYLQLSRTVFDDEELHYYSKWIFVVLNELEQRYTGKNETYFFRSDADLAKDCGLSVKTIQRYKKPLIDKKYVQHWNMHWIDTETKKKSERKVSAYRVLR